MTFNYSALNVEVICSAKRKRLAIRVLNKQVQLLTPLTFCHASARSFLDKHITWIHKKLEEQAQVLDKPKAYVEGESFLFLGEWYTLNIAFSPHKPFIVMQDQRLFVFVKPTTSKEKCVQQVSRALKRWYEARALEILTQKTEVYAKRLGVNYRSISVHHFKSRWGSCSVQAQIKYHWAIIQAPHAVIDYLVVHELSHIKHHNHSAAFWNTVASVMPDYKQYKQWLKLHGASLNLS